MNVLHFGFSLQDPFSKFDILMCSCSNSTGHMQGMCISLSIITVSEQTFVDQLLQLKQQKQCTLPNTEAL